MRAFLAALVLAGALVPFPVAFAPERLTRVAQMSRDVTDAVRRQRERPRAHGNRITGEGRR